MSGKSPSKGESNKLRDLTNDNELEAKVSWSAEDESAGKSRILSSIVLLFYGLDSIKPTAWIEDKTTRQDSTEVLAVDASPTANNDVSAGDPLGIKDNYYARMLRDFKFQKNADKKTSILISERNFNADVFLQKVHKNTSYKEMEIGLSKLRIACEQQNEVTKSLVKRHFSKFVSAKGNIDAFYVQIRQQNLIGAEDYGVIPYLNQLNDLIESSESLYIPILDRRFKSERLRQTLVFLEQWKFSFHLPISLQLLITKGEYDAAVRDYKKGKSALSNASKKNCEDENLKSTLRIFEKIWEEVEKIANQLRELLFTRLTSDSCSTEELERTINHLKDLDSEKDPVIFYLENQYQWLIQEISRSHFGYIYRLKGAQKSNPNNRTTKKNKIREARITSKNEHDNNAERSRFEVRGVSLVDFKRALTASQNNQLEEIYASDSFVFIWKTTTDHLFRVCKILESSISKFWSIYKKFVNYEKGSTNAAGAIFKNLIATSFKIAGEVFRKTLFLKDQIGSSDIVTDEDISSNSAAINIEAPSAEIEDFLKCHPIVITYFAQKLMDVCGKCYENIKNLNMPEYKDSLGPLALAMEQVQDRFVDSICNNLISSTEIFHSYEKWTYDCRQFQTSKSESNILVNSTNFVKMFQFYQKVILKSLYSIVTVKLGASRKKNFDNVELNALADVNVKSNNFEKIMASFLNCQFIFLDGLEYLVTNREGKDLRSLENFDESRWESSGLQMKISIDKRGSLSLDQINSSVKLKLAAEENRDTGIRCITILGNLHYYKNVAIPKILSILEKKYVLPFRPGDVKNIYDSIDQLDAIVFNNYIKRQSLKLRDIAHHGILFSGLEWHNIKKLQGIIILNVSNYYLMPYCYQILLKFVLVHSQVCNVSTSLVRRVIGELLSLLLQDILKCYRRIDGFSLGGMLQATMETEFIHQSLRGYETPAIAAVFKLIYDTLEHGRIKSSDDSSHAMDEMLKKVKILISNARKATGNQLLCFRDNETQEENEV